MFSEIYVRADTITAQDYLLNFNIDREDEVWRTPLTPLTKYTSPSSSNYSCPDRSKSNQYESLKIAAGTLEPQNTIAIQPKPIITIQV